MSIPIYRFAMQEGLNSEEFLPKRATNKSSGWDVFAVPEDKKSIFLRPGQYVKIPLGFRVIAPDGWWLELKPRSSTFAKKNLNALYGTIDSDYRGYMAFVCQYIPDVRNLGTSLEIKLGEAIGQIIPVMLQDMEIRSISNKEFDKFCKYENNDRGAGGFGSTSK